MLLALIRHSARPSERSAQRLLKQVMVNPVRVQHRMGARWETLQAYMLDRARTPSVQKANRALLREIGIPPIPPEDLARIRVPTTLIWGRHDRVMRLRYAQEASARYGWPLHVIDDAGHVVFAEQPEAVLEVLRAALGEG